MILDGHIHIGAGPVKREDFVKKLQAADISGGVLLSQPPACFAGALMAISPQARVDNVLDWSADNPNLHPFYWIDPTESDALAQVALAVEKGVAGFKVICSRHYPGDSRAMPVYQAIADAGKPILFHSGILWDGQPSSQYNRPSNFEALLTIKGLRFALAHISWPWVDACIAVYGKFQAALQRRDDLDVEMFIDTTPGTPPIYRREALTKLFTVGYTVAHNVFFGVDSSVNAYNSDYAKQWLQRDQAIFAELELEDAVINNVFSENLKRFLGLSA